MALQIKLEKGTLLQCPEGDYDLINGMIYPKIRESEPLSEAVRYIYGEYKKYSLACRPLDHINAPQELLPMRGCPDTFLKPEIAVMANGEDFPVWAVEFQDNETEAIASQLKPVLYRESGLKEYWVIDLDKKIVIIYNFDQFGYVQNVISVPQRIPVKCFKGFLLSFSEIFKKK